MSLIRAPYKPRAIRFQDVWDVMGWRLKTYFVTAERKRPRLALISSGKTIAKEILSSVPAALRHYGVGFVGIHDGRVGNMVFIDWWADENELHHHSFASPAQDPGRLKYMTPTGLIACVWELDIMAFEKQAWLDTVLNNPRGPDLDAYLERRLNVDA